jgi:hypothetical protein
MGFINTKGFFGMVTFEKELWRKIDELRRIKARTMMRNVISLDECKSEYYISSFTLFFDLLRHKMLRRIKRSQELRIFLV